MTHHQGSWWSVWCVVDSRSPSKNQRLKGEWCGTPRTGIPTPRANCDTAGLHTPARLAVGLEPGVALSTQAVHRPLSNSPRCAIDSRLGSPATPLGALGVNSRLRLLT